MAGKLGVLLACFGETKTAGKARRDIETRLRSQGDAVLDTAVLRVDEHHKASVYDPRRTRQGALTAALTWGLFGLAAGTDRVESVVIWAVLGAMCGGAYAYLAEHLLSKSELARIGARLPAGSSAVLTFAESGDAGHLLHATADHRPEVASAAIVDTDLSARVFAGPDYTLEVSGGSPVHPMPPSEASVVDMVMVRYPAPDTAKQVASQLPPGADTLEVELVIRTDRDGRRHVSEPSTGVATYSRSAMVSWGLFGVAFGAVVGALGGGGFLAFVEDGVITGVLWAIFGLAAGTLYGLWAGRSVSARRLKSVGSLLPPGSSMVLAWVEKPLHDDTLATVTTPGSQRLVLRFNPVESGAILEAS